MKNLFTDLYNGQDEESFKEIDFENYFSQEEFKNVKAENKIDLAKAAHAVLEKKVNGKDGDSDAGFCGKYYFYGMGFISANAVEIFAKALFMLLFKRKEPGRSLHIAVDFEIEKDYAKEFIRIFSVFYEKQESSKYMENVQIAVCSENPGKRMKEVNFVLAGKNLASAYETANNFVYYNAEASLEFLPLLKFLKRDGEKENDKANEPIFPFDLYLKGKDGQSGESWFIEDMRRRLETDLWSDGYGCKISGVAVRVGSKIVIDAFYEAELLFQNAGTVKRFAYLLAKDILKSTGYDDYKNRRLFLLAHENYSAVLIQEVNSLLIAYAEKKKEKGEKWYLKDNIYWVLDVRTHVNLPSVSFERISNVALKSVIEKAADGKTEIDCVTVTPINTTMFTVYKLHNSFINGLCSKCKDFFGVETDKEEFENSLRKKVNFVKNYCLVAVGNGFTGTKLSEIEQKYIRSVSPYKDGYKTVTLLKEKSDKKQCEEPIAKRTEVKIMIAVKSNWTEIEKFVDSNKPLLQVDKTSTLVDTYFQSAMPEKVLDYYNTEENQ